MNSLNHTNRLVAALLLAGLLAISSTAIAAEIATDKGDYAPGEIAMIAGWGFFPGELIDLSISIDDPLSGGHIGDWEWTQGYADEYGEFLVGYIVPQEAAGMNLTATAMGLESSLIASVTFTDTPPNPQRPLQFVETGLPSGTNWSVTVTELSPTTKNSTTNTIAWGGVDVGQYYTYTIGAVTGYVPSPPSGSGTMPSGTGPVQVNITFSPASTNAAPVIMALNPTVDLGAWVGCLGGPGFSRTFAVSYGVVAGTRNSKIVQATFTLPDATTVTVDVANVTDADATDTITVTLANGTNPVTINGPGLGSAPFSVDVRANDGTVTVPATGWTTCSGTAVAQIIYDFVGFLRPLDNDTATKVKRGSAVPVKFQLFDCSGNPITTGNHTIGVLFLSGAAPDGPVDVDDAGKSGDEGINFRYSLTDQCWIFNLKTNTSYDIGSSYTITAYLGDGTTDHSATISIK